MQSTHDLDNDSSVLAQDHHLVSSDHVSQVRLTTERGPTGRAAIHFRTRCKETFVNGQTCQRKGEVTASPRAKVEVKARARSRKGNYNQDQAGFPNEDGQRTSDDFVF